MWRLRPTGLRWKTYLECDYRTSRDIASIFVFAGCFLILVGMFMIYVGTTGNDEWHFDIVGPLVSVIGFFFVVLGSVLCTSLEVHHTIKERRKKKFKITAMFVRFTEALRLSQQQHEPDSPTSSTMSRRRSSTRRRLSFLERHFLPRFSNASDRDIHCNSTTSVAVGLEGMSMTAHAVPGAGNSLTTPTCSEATYSDGSDSLCIRDWSHPPSPAFHPSSKFNLSATKATAGGSMPLSPTSPTFLTPDFAFRPQQLHTTTAITHAPPPPAFSSSNSSVGTPKQCAGHVGLQGSPSGGRGSARAASASPPNTPSKLLPAPKSFGQRARVLSPATKANSSPPGAAHNDFSHAVTSTHCNPSTSKHAVPQIRKELAESPQPSTDDEMPFNRSQESSPHEDGVQDDVRNGDSMEEDEELCDECLAKETASNSQSTT